MTSGAITPLLELNGVSATAHTNGIHTSILKHAPCMNWKFWMFLVLKKA